MKSKTPWSLKIDKDIWNPLFCKNNKQIGLIGTDDNSKFIVLAVNNHEWLLQTAKEFLYWIENEVPYREVNIENLKKGIKQVEGEK